MKVKARVERPDFFLRGEKRSIGTKVLVSEAEWKQFGSSGTGQLAFIEYREDHDTPPDNDVDASPEARALAMKAGVKLSDIEPSGKTGAVLIGDVREHIKKQKE